jgi:hypothetical protein
MPLIRSFAQQNRGPGLLLAPDANGFNVGNNANSKLELRTLMSQATLDSAATHFTLGLEVLRGGLWQFSAGIEFQGGPNQGRGGTATVAPGFKADMAEYRSQTVRLALNLDTQISIGAEIWRTR